MFVIFRNLIRQRHTLLTIAVRDFRARYLASYVGVFWAFIQPLTQVLIYTFVFSIILKVRPGPAYEGTSFTVWLMSGMLPWIFFSEAVTSGVSSVMENQQMITKTIFPAEVFPAARIVTALFGHGIFLGIVVLSIVFGHYQHALDNRLFLTVLLVPFYILVIVLLALGIALFLSALNVYVRDILPLTGVALNLWFFYTPIMYPMTSIPSSLYWLAWINPLYHVVEWYRGALLSGKLPEVESIFYVCGFILVTLTIGARTFARLKTGFADVM